MLLSLLTTNNRYLSIILLLLLLVLIYNFIVILKIVNFDHHQFDVLNNNISNKEQHIISNSRFDEKNHYDRLLLHSKLCPTPPPTTTTTNNQSTTSSSSTRQEWDFLCRHSFVQNFVNRWRNENQTATQLIQIGAHVGFEPNDPVASELVTLLAHLSSSSDNDSSSHNKIHWSFVEPSPPNFKTLVQNMDKYQKDLGDVVNMTAIHAAIVPNNEKDDAAQGNKVFYSIRDTIDPETGYDSLSGKTFPHWITQVSSFSKDPIYVNRKVFKDNRVQISDYIVESQVPTMSYKSMLSHLLPFSDDSDGDDGVSNNSSNRRGPFLVLIDTEGYDCSILNDGILSSSSAADHQHHLLPEYLIFEHQQCNRNDKQSLSRTAQNLSSNGYTCDKVGTNTVCSFI